MDEMNNMQPTRLCQEFAAILGATPSVINGVCTATRSRDNLHPTVLGRRAESFMFVPQAFSFEQEESHGEALCLGETVILQDEVNPFVSILRKNGIIVTAIHNHWLFDDPRLMYIHWESIDKPLDFARKTREALKVLTTRNVRGYSRDRGRNRPNPNAEGLCEQFHQILGGDHTFENGVCMIMRSRLNLKPRILGRPTRSFLAVPQMFTFESLTPDGRALCSGESVILEEEFNPLASKLRGHGIIITAFHNHWLFDSPRLMYIHFVKIDNPVQFARDVRDSFKVLEG
ncbi:hypothetical protein CUC15_19280 [Oceanobacillus zhaokaii]|uniref:DUF1259 domain-containing protein n=1 Tax=Oceanobacillus zhaokaii TaxID=2052660 RepID=A0A345PLR1_9BACI|nr:DUF1259 domain-containing protein [Oceanobacillus zhaokaii]AXI10941.1 hypothetical protein CUC15_19280 [Oceanobacillus zhaokaii]